MSCGLARFYRLQLSDDSSFGSLDDDNDSSGGERKMIVEPIESSNAIKVKHVKEKRILELTIDDARSFKEIVFDGKDGKEDSIKLEAHITYKGKTKEDPDVWRINNKSRNILIATWGKNTDNWVNKAIPITVAGEGEMQHILVDAMRIGN
jgi:hypothetical protein